MRYPCQSSERQMHSMLKKDFWNDLPKELIAQEPASPRDSARLMVLSQKDDSIQHKIFRDLPDFLEPGDLLVVSNTKVLPAASWASSSPPVRSANCCCSVRSRATSGNAWQSPAS